MPLRAYSRFLTAEMERDPALLTGLMSSGALFRPLGYDDVRERLERFLEPFEAARLARFRRREMLGILLRDVRGIDDLAGTTGAISLVADVMLDVVYRRLRVRLEERFGTPLCDGEPCGLSIIALGKLGGEELNYSSDIDLMFVYSGGGHTSGASGIANHEFFKRLCAQFVEMLSSHTAEGLAYRVDLRLRPEGRLGEICLSVDAARHYYLNRARDWELQMLIKARPSAGERAPARALLDAVEDRIYSTSLDFNAIESVSQSRERIHEQQANRRLGQGEINVKLCPGGIRDIEFLVQCLQRLHGGRERWLRHGGTLLSLFRLRDKGLVTATEYARLASAYQFLRTLEHRLQVLDDLQTHSLPLDAESLAAVALRMPPLAGAEVNGAWLRNELVQHCTEVTEIYKRVIQNGTGGGGLTPGLPKPPTRGAARFERFLDNIRQSDDLLGYLNGDPLLAEQVVSLFDASPFLADQLLRSPELLRQFDRFGYGIADPPAGAGAAGLRRWFRNEMFRTQCESVCLSRPVFDTLEEVSRLGEMAVAAAYDLAVRGVAAAHPPQSAHYRPRQQMMVIALGRMGMREFDLGSDADLVFVLPNRDATEIEYWTRVAEKLIDILTAYTGEGVLVAVDTRLRPNGRAGPLVQTVQAFKNYFDRSAEAWEGLALMKSLAVAGDIKQATEFLNELQVIDWRRYGQSGRSQNDLRKMRVRLEKETGPSNPLKAGPGGYYDIDFALMYMRLRSAGLFFVQLNTPKRIDIVEKTGYLDRTTARFLREAATFYRAIDHGLRLIHGHAGGTLPKSQAELETLSDLVRRWTGGGGNLPLPDEYEHIRNRTRQVFDRLFPAIP
ncbi:MAG: glutamine-synthetase adenylyltransferase [Acidobacteria bacterium]|nr:glutamine-synthetase adenylyltransferase [Acidobacteriota bacterium]